MKTKAQMINDIVASMESWDNDEVLNWAQAVRRDILEKSNIKTVKFEYENISKYHLV